MALLVQRNSNHFIACASAFIPRPVLGSEDIALVLGGKLFGVIQRHLQRGIVRLQEHVGIKHPGAQVRVFILVARVDVAAHVIPGPTVEAAILHMGDVIRGQILAESVSFIDRCPQLSGLGMDSNTNRIADARGVDALTRSVGIELEDVGPVIFDGIIIRIVDIGVGPYRDIHFLSIT